MVLILNYLCVLQYHFCFWCNKCLILTNAIQKLTKPSSAPLAKSRHISEMSLQSPETKCISCLHNLIRQPRLQTRPARAPMDQGMRGADLSLVVVGRSFTVANGFVPLKQEDDEKM